MTATYVCHSKTESDGSVARNQLKHDVEDVESRVVGGIVNLGSLNDADEPECETCEGEMRTSQFGWTERSRTDAKDLRT